MERNLEELTRRELDVIVVGGGVFGCAAAWDAAQRGLSVALIERKDFSSQTSASSFKVIHGGIRYVQHADVPRVRESSHERKTLFRIAPHLTHPLPIVIPTYGRGMQGKGILRIGSAVYDLLTLDRNKGLESRAHRVPAVRSLSRKDVLDEFPGLDAKGLTGGVLMHDGQMYNPPRIALSYLRSAVDKGALVANWLQVDGFLKEDGRVCGVRATDLAGGGELEVRAKVVVNAAGPWAGRLLGESLGETTRPPLTFSRDACFIIPRRLTGDRALAVLGQTKDPDAVLARPKRHLFFAPWRDYTLVGVWHKVYKDHPDRFTVTEDELQVFLDEINAGYAGMQLTLDDISMWNAGLVLFGENADGAEDLSYGKRSLVIDHAREHGIEGLVSMVGVRYTTSRGVAQKVLDIVFRKLGKGSPKCRTAETPLWGGDIGDLDEFIVQGIAKRPEGVSEASMRCLLRNYGSQHGRVLEYVRQDASLGEVISGSKVLRAEVVHAVREEMALGLADVVCRRTDLGTGRNPGEEALRQCVDLMAAELGWDDARKSQEIAEVSSLYLRPVATASTPQAET